MHYLKTVPLGAALLFIANVETRGETAICVDCPDPKNITLKCTATDCTAQGNQQGIPWVGLALDIPNPKGLSLSSSPPTPILKNDLPTCVYNTNEPGIKFTVAYMVLEGKCTIPRATPGNPSLKCVTKFSCK